MYFDFDDRYRDIEPVGSAINRRDGVAVSIMVHLVSMEGSIPGRELPMCLSAGFPQQIALIVMAKRPAKAVV